MASTRALPDREVFSFHVVGLRQIDRMLQQLPQHTSAALLRNALKRTAKPTAEKAKGKARRSREPWRHKLNPIHMADSIKIRSMKHSGIARKFGVHSRRGAAMALGPDRNHYWGLFVEFGTFKMDAEPFMRPAWDADKGTLIPRFGTEVWKGIARTIKRFEREAKQVLAGTRKLSRRLSEL